MILSEKELHLNVEMMGYRYAQANSDESSCDIGIEVLKKAKTTEEFALIAKKIIHHNPFDGEMMEKILDEMNLFFDRRIQEAKKKGWQRHLIIVK